MHSVSKSISIRLDDDCLAAGQRSATGSTFVRSRARVRRARGACATVRDWRSRTKARRKRVSLALADEYAKRSALVTKSGFVAPTRTATSQTTVRFIFAARRFVLNSRSPRGDGGGSRRSSSEIPRTVSREAGKLCNFLISRECAAARKSLFFSFSSLHRRR